MTEKNRFLIFKEETALRDILFIPLFLSLYLVYYFFQDAGFHLESFSGRPISVATSEAIDIGKRVSSFYNAFVVFMLLAFSFTYVILRARPLLRLHDLHLLNASSVAGICLLFFQLLGAEMLPGLHLIIAIQLVIFLGIALRLKWTFHNADNFYTALFVWIISLSFSLYFLQIQLFQLAGISGSQSLPVFLSVFSSVLLLYYSLFQRTNAFNSSIVHANIFITVPLAFLPLLSVLTTEFYMILNQRNIHSPGIKFIYSVLLLLIAVWMAYRNIKWKKSVKPEQTDLFQVLGRTWFPVLCIGVSAVATYKPIVSVRVDWFEDANRILPLQQWFDFGKIPFLDTFSSHAFSDFGPGALFSLLNGYNPLGGFVYQFLIPVLVTLVIYLFVFRITQNGMIALFLALFYPYSDFILPSYYNLIPVTILMILNIYRKQSVTNYFAFFAVLVLMVFWRIDLGSANLVAGIGSLLILSFAVPGFKTNYKQLLKGFIIFLVGTLVIFLIAALLYDGNIFNRISEALGYMSSFQSYGLKDLSGAKDIKYYSLYFVLPVAVFLSATHAFVKLIRNKDNQQSVTYLALSILFLSIFFFTNFQRGLVRHTLAEQWDTALTSYGFFILAAGVFFNARFRKNKAIIFFLFITVSTLLVINYKFSSPELTKNNMYFVAKQQIQQQLFTPPSNIKINRTIETADVAENYIELDTFLKNNFPTSSTFLDFSNSPMLYHYLSRVTPNYFCQIPHTAHNDKMQRDLLDGLKKYDIPVVVFSNVPVTFWDYLDGIPNTLRHYRISEYIYLNYKPYAILNKHSVWIKKNLELRESRTSHLVDLKNLKALEINRGTLIDSVTVQGVPDENLRLKNIITTPVELRDSLFYYLNLKLSSTSQATLSLIASFSGPNGIETKKTDIRILAGYSEPFIIIEKKPGEQLLQSIELQLPSAITCSFKLIQLNECTFIPDLYSSQVQEQSLKFIPYVWGNYDVIHQKDQTETISKLLDQKHTLEADREIRIKTPLLTDKKSGNYIHLKARSKGAKPSDVILNYGQQNEKRGGVLFTVMNGEQVKDYRIRISSQYNWWRTDVEWISVYSVGSDLELELIEIEKGD